jgi:2,3-bisphosphoglycerate-independent phosphoglycerate mutase
LSSNESKALLVILDGWGLGDDPEVSAIHQASTPCFDSLIDAYPNARLSASGTDVGLPEGQFGNSEVGHLNIGAGRIVWQDLSRINKDIDEGTFSSNAGLKETFSKASKKGRLHILGLFSDGGVHSHNDHLFALLNMAGEYDLDNIWVHAFTDGRDTSPHGGIDFYREFRQKADEAGIGKIASLSGRYYAMDRDNRWERTERAYRLLVNGEGHQSKDPEDVFTRSYQNNVTDEFIEPSAIEPVQDSRIQKGDTLLFYNVRADRTRQIIKALLQFKEVPFRTESLDLDITTLTAYDEQFAPYIRVAYPPETLTHTLGEWLSIQGKRQLRIAETEKYPHVTYFFNGGIEKAYKGEERTLIPSPKVATYDLQPEMSAAEVTTALTDALKTEQYNLAVVNYANPDMVGHTGNMEAAIKAVETVDRELSTVVDIAREHDYKVLVISDHGNADRLRQPDGSSHTAHTTADVPAILIGMEKARMSNGRLADVAPTLLKMMGLEQPPEMTGKTLF